MKFSNFKFVGESRNHATVIVETGMWWWKRVETQEICRTGQLYRWHIVNTGQKLSVLEDRDLSGLETVERFKLAHCPPTHDVRETPPPYPPPRRLYEDIE